ncbi:MAG: hypothetical protein AAF660_07470 [Pseudomonadota bacterium]
MTNVTEFATRGEIEDDLLVVDYVAGRLTGDARMAFETQLASDAELRLAVEEERQLRAALTAAPDVGVPPATGFESLRDEIASDRSPVAWRHPSVAAGAALIAFAFLLALLRPGGDTLPDVEDAAFTGLSENPALVSDGNTVTIVFAPGVSADERADISAQLGFTLVDGPNAVGAWTAVATVDVDRETLTRWREDPRIDLAEPRRYESP